MTVTKEVLINKIYDEVGLSKATSKKVVEALIELIKESLERGENVLISGFGKFVVREKRPRRGRNPQTGEEIQLRGRRVVTFKISSVLKKKINQS
jgi:integration host factor subunit alpha